MDFFKGFSGIKSDSNLRPKDVESLYAWECIIPRPRRPRSALSGVSVSLRRFLTLVI